MHVQRGKVLPFFSPPYAFPSLSLSRSLDGSSKHRLALAPFLRRPQSRGWGLACEWGTVGVLASRDTRHVKGTCPHCAAHECPCRAPPHSLPPAPPNHLPPQGSRRAAGIHKTPFCVASDPASGLGVLGWGTRTVPGWPRRGGSWCPAGRGRVVGFALGVRFPARCVCSPSWLLDGVRGQG